ncbi:16361_t:CDS:2, partial [Acaulospora colombiana]
PGPQKRAETYRALQELVKQGKVKSIGVSNYGVKHLKELMDSNPEIMPAVNQIEGLQNNFVVLPKSTNEGHIIYNTEVYDFVIEEGDMKTLNCLDERFVAG